MSTAPPGSETAPPGLAGTTWAELVAELTVGVLLHDERGTVLAANPKAAELLGVSSIDLLNGRRPDGWVPCDESGTPLPRIADLAGQVFDAGLPAAAPFVITVHGLAQRRLWAEVYPVPLPGARLLVSVLQPVQTDLRRGRGLLDPLTGLPSRALLFDRLEQALIRARTHGIMASVVLADLRGLGRINAELGFAQGDQLISVVARRLRAELRADHTVARYAGGTFAVVADHPHGTAEPISDRIRAIAERRVTVGPDPLLPSVRTGFATSDGSDTGHELIRIAEARLRT